MPYDWSRGGQEPTPKRPKQHGQVTRADVKRYPAYYISGPGRNAASASDCGHGYWLTDSCPMCD